MLKALPANVQASLVEMQYRGRQLTYSTQYPQAKDSIICLEDGRSVGRLLVVRREDHLRVIDVAILPEWQGRGIGRSVLTMLAQQGRDEGVEIRLRVYLDNPAIRLYSLLGFVVADRDEISCEMSLNSAVNKPTE